MTESNDELPNETPKENIPLAGRAHRCLTVGLPSRKTYALHKKWRYLAYDGTWFLTTEQPAWNSHQEFFETSFCETHELEELFRPNSLPHLSRPEEAYGMVWRRNPDTDQWERIK